MQRERRPGAWRLRRVALRRAKVGLGASAGAVCAGLALAVVASAGAATGRGRAHAGVNPRLGRSIFEAECGSCHSFAAAGSEGTLGPDLDAVSKSLMTEDWLRRLIANGGPAGATSAATMPAFQGVLSTAEIADVAAFIYASTHPAATASAPAVEHVTVTIGRSKPASCLLSKASVRRGKIVFTVANRGRVSRGFEIDGERTRAIAPRRSARLVVVLAKPRRYPYSCPGASRTHGVGARHSLEVT